jgi:hypothetical protein
MVLRIRLQNFGEIFVSVLNFAYGVFVQIDVLAAHMTFGQHNSNEFQASLLFACEILFFSQNQRFM